MTPSPIHESIIRILHAGFERAKTALPASYGNEIKICPNSVFELDPYSPFVPSSKVPDLALAVRDDAKTLRPKLAFEVGFSQSYKQLKEAAELMLKGDKNIHLVVLIKFLESPQYSRPQTNADLSRDKIIREEFVFEKEFGPVKARELTWIGEISAFMEFWELDSEKEHIVQKGQRIVRESINLFLL